MCYALVEWLKEKLPEFYAMKPTVVQVLFLPFPIVTAGFCLFIFLVHLVASLPSVSYVFVL
jgi:hypothetical protein